MASLGGRLRHLISAGAPLDARVAKQLDASGLTLLEGYGLTESCGLLSLSSPQERRLGAVGKPLPGVDLTLGLDAEILARGPTISPGYWSDEAATAACRDEQGWFYTGDLGRFDKDGFLWLTGRKRELITTLAGKPLAPHPIERRLEASPLIEHAVVLGQGRPYVIALLSLAAGPAWAWALAQGLDAAMPLEHLASSDALRRAMGQHVMHVNAQGPSHEAVRKFVIVPVPFSRDQGLLTPTLKVRREAIAQRWAVQIEALYHPPEGVLTHDVDEAQVERAVQHRRGQRGG